MDALQPWQKYILHTITERLEPHFTGETMAEKETILKPKARGISGLSQDVQAIAAIDRALVEALEPLNPADKDRVLNWLKGKYFRDWSIVMLPDDKAGA